MRDFTPVFDILIKNHGIYTALVYGRVWRYCQGERNECLRSQSKLAKDLGIGRTKVNTSLSTLVEGGFLTSTPIGRGRKSYQLTEKISCSRNEQLTKHTGPVHEMNNGCSPDEQPTFKRDSKRGIKRGDATKKRKRSHSTPPAVELARRINRRYPPKKLHGMIDRTVGHSFGALLKWGRIIRQWIASGYNPTNYQGMIEVFRSGWLRSQQKASGLTQGMEALTRAHDRAEVDQ